MKMFIAYFFRLTDEESVRRQLRDGGAVWLCRRNKCFAIFQYAERSVANVLHVCDYLFFR